MMSETAYFTARAAEADRLAGLCDDPRVRSIHEEFASVYRERLTSDVAVTDEDEQ